MSKKDQTGKLSGTQNGNANQQKSINKPGLDRYKKTSQNGYRKRDNINHSKRYQANETDNQRPKLNDEDDIMLARSILKSTKHGIDITDLLNYTIADDDNRVLESQQTAKLHRRRRRSSHRRSQTVHLSGQSYINVNYKFIVDYRLSYKQQIMDPNIPLDEKNIVRVLVNGKDYQCPICLSEEFVAPRMTRCGHIFCYHCLLRLFAASEAQRDDNKYTRLLPGNRTATCPLCNDVIRERNRLLPVLITKDDTRAPVIGDTISMTLMYRNSENVLAQPIQLYLENSMFQGNIPWIEYGSTPKDFFKTSKYTRYARLMKCDKDFMLACLKDELKSIDSHEKYDKEVYHEAGTYYNSAHLNINAEMETIEQSFSKEKNGAVRAPSYRHIDHNGPLTDDEMVQLQVAQDQFTFDPQEKGYCFYQCLTGSNPKVRYFLSGLDIQIFKAIYGEYMRFPFEIRVKLENINYENNLVTEEMIHKLKYLGHLPIGTEVGFCELDWFASNNMIPPVLYSRFKARLKKRSKRTKSRKLREDRNKKDSQKELELKTLKFYSSENNLPLERYGIRESTDFPTIPIADAFQPSLESTYSPNVSDKHQDDNDSTVHYESSVWGTQIPVSEAEMERRTNDSIDVENMIEKAKKQQSKGKGRKKKRIILSFN